MVDFGQMKDDATKKADDMKDDAGDKIEDLKQRRKEDQEQNDQSGQM